MTILERENSIVIQPVGNRRLVNVIHASFVIASVRLVARAMIASPKKYHELSTVRLWVPLFIIASTYRSSRRPPTKGNFIKPNVQFVQGSREIVYTTIYHLLLRNYKNKNGNHWYSLYQSSVHLHRYFRLSDFALSEQKRIIWFYSNNNDAMQTWRIWTIVLWLLSIVEKNMDLHKKKEETWK